MSDLFGPWAEVDPTERTAQFRSLASIAKLLLGPRDNGLVDALRDAELDLSAADRALELLKAVPALVCRRMLATFGAVQWPRRRCR
jgi:hypothetical protein